MKPAPSALSRLRTRGVLLDLIRSARTISRVELVDGAGLTGATITNVVRELIDDGLVMEVGRGASTGGKPRTLLELNASARYAVGVQLDRGSAVVVVLDLAGQLVARTALGGSGTRSPHEYLLVVAEHIDALLATTGIEREKIIGVGLVSHGPQDRTEGRLQIDAPTADWLNYPLVADLEEILHLPVLLDNDATAAAIGEFWLGGVHPASTYGSIYMASGIGGGVVVAGEAYRGASSNGVEIGHISLDVNGELCGCGNRGCVEGFAGPPATIDAARAVPGLAARLGLTGDRDDTVADFARIGRAAASGDSEAHTLIETSARYLGHAAVTLANLFDLDRIVLAGPSFTTAGSIYLHGVQAELEKAAFIRRVRPVIAILSASGANAAAVGGAVLMLKSELTPMSRLQPDGRALNYTFS